MLAPAREPKRDPDCSVGYPQSKHRAFAFSTDIKLLDPQSGHVAVCELDLAFGFWPGSGGNPWSGNGGIILIGSCDGGIEGDGSGLPTCG